MNAAARVGGADVVAGRADLLRGGRGREGVGAARSWRDAVISSAGDAGGRAERREGGWRPPDAPGGGFDSVCVAVVASGGPPRRCERALVGNEVASPIGRVVYSRDVSPRRRLELWDARRSRRVGVLILAVGSRVDGLIDLRLIGGAGGEREDGGEEQQRATHGVRDGTTTARWGKGGCDTEYKQELDPPGERALPSVVPCRMR